MSLNVEQKASTLHVLLLSLASSNSHHDPLPRSSSVAEVFTGRVGKQQTRLRHRKFTNLYMQTRVVVFHGTWATSISLA